MSIAFMQEVWSLRLNDASKKLVLLAMADNADEEGICWPSVRNIAMRSEISERQVQRDIAALIKDGLVRVLKEGQRAGRGRASQSRWYQLTPENGSDIMSRPSNHGPDKNFVGHAKSEDGRAIATAPESSDKSPYQPSETPNTSCRSATDEDSPTTASVCPGVEATTQPCQPKSGDVQRKEGRPNPKLLLDIYEQEHGSLPAVKLATAERLKKSACRLINHSEDLTKFLTDFRAAIGRAGRMQWPAWRPTFDWFISNDSNYLKVLEGAYDGWGNKSKASKNGERQQNTRDALNRVFGDA